MAITAITGFLYGVVQETWLVTAVLAKYVLLGNLGVLAYQKDLSPESFEDQLLKWARPMVLGFTLLGTVLYISSFSVTPMFRFFSELVAVATLGFLFWKY